MTRGELERLYPTGQRNYVRIAAADHLAAVALVKAAKELRWSRVFLPRDGDDPYTAGVADEVRAAARTLGLDVAGAAGWDPGAHDFARLARHVAEATTRRGPDGRSRAAGEPGAAARPAVAPGPPARAHRKRRLLRLQAAA